MDEDSQSSRAAEPIQGGNHPRGASIGRYLVLDRLGQGGMGVVYAAYDPELDRRVALKVVRGQAGPTMAESRARLMREALALAKLNHPNVVAVHDAGLFEGNVFIAMDLVEGQTLRQWLTSERPWREVVPVFVAAARGLGAAHDKGLIHRDFKPENVVVGSDGLVRVLDFGLARAHREVSAQESQEAALPVPVPVPGADANANGNAVFGAGAAQARASLHSRVTRDGTLPGTIGYLAPELFNGQPADAQSDQFSFCCALYEALYGRGPFGSEVTQYIAQICSNAPLQFPARPAIPGHLRRLLSRGLSHRQEDRYPSMASLLVDLEYDLSRHRQRWYLLAGAVGLAGLAAVTALQVGARPAPCQGARAAWQAALDDASMEKVTAAFQAATVPGKEDALARVSAALARYGQEWQTQHREACEATHVGGTQSAEVLDLKMGCLKRHLLDAQKLVHVLGSADDGVVTQAPQAAQQLPPLDDCLDVPALQAKVKRPADPEARARIDALEGQLASVRAMALAGRFEAATALARTLVPEAERIRYLPSVAEAKYELGALLIRVEGPEFERLLEEAVVDGLTAHHDRVAAQSAIGLILVGMANENRYAEGRRWEQLARALVSRLEARTLLEAYLENHTGILEAVQGDPQAAIKRFERSLSLLIQVPGHDEGEVGIMLSNIGEQLILSNRAEDGLVSLRRAEAVYARSYGPESHAVGIVLGHQADALVSLHRCAEARERATRGTEILERSVGPEHVFLMVPLTVLGECALAARNHVDARRWLERAERICRSTGGYLRFLPRIHLGLAEARWQAADRPGAVGMARAGLEEARRAGTGGADIARKLEAWLASHSP